MSTGSRWYSWSTLIIFLFLTLSGSRRNYYTLPMVPFATLLTADWIRRTLNNSGQQGKRFSTAAVVAIISYLLLFSYYNILTTFYYSGGGLKPFAQQVQTQANKIQSWSKWNITLLDAGNELTLYLKPGKPITILGMPDATLADKLRERDSYSAEDLIKIWPAILARKPDTILITRQLYLSKLQPYLKNYQIIMAKPTWGQRLLNDDNSFVPVALVPL